MLSFGLQARPVVVTTGHCDGRLTVTDSVVVTTSHCDGRLMAGRYDVRLMLSSAITEIGLRRYPIW